MEEDLRHEVQVRSRQVDARARDDTEASCGSTVMQTRRTTKGRFEVFLDDLRLTSDQRLCFDNDVSEVKCA
jgi:hypothetical protein